MVVGGVQLSEVIVQNSGVIAGDALGVGYVMPPNGTTTHEHDFTITNSGMISGGAAAIRTGAGNDTLNLTTEGEIVGAVLVTDASFEVPLTETNTLNLSGTGASHFFADTSTNFGPELFPQWRGFTDLNVLSGTWTLVGSADDYRSRNIAAGATLIVDNSNASLCPSCDNTFSGTATINGTLRQKYDDENLALLPDPDAFQIDSAFEVVDTYLGNGRLELTGGRTAVVVRPGDYPPGYFLEGFDFGGTVSVSDGFRTIVSGAANTSFEAAAGGAVFVGGELVFVPGSFADPAYKLVGTGATGEVNGDLSALASGTVIFNRSNDYTFAGDMSGDGRFEKRGGGVLTLTGDATDFTGEFEVVDGLLGFGNTSDAGFGGNLTGTGALAKTGAGILTLTGDNSGLTGGIDIFGGGIVLGSDTAAGAGPIRTFATFIGYNDGVTNAAPIILNSNDTELNVAGGAATQSGLISEAGGSRPLKKTGDGTLILAAHNTYTGGTTVIRGTLILGDESSIQGDVTVEENGWFGFLRNDDVAFSGRLFGDGIVSKQGAGILTLTSDNLSTGGVFVYQGEVRLAGAGTLGGSLRELRVGDHSTGPAILDLGGKTQSANLVVVASESAILNGSLEVSELFVLTGGSISTNVTGNGALLTSGNGQITLSGENSYTGGTFVGGNSHVILSGGKAIGNLSNVLVRSSAVLELQANETVGSLRSSETLGGGFVELNGFILTLGDDNSNTNYDGAISGSGKLIKQGGGVFTLSGNNTFSGGIDILHGGISLGSNTAAGTGPITTYGSVIDYLNGVNNAAPVIIASNTTQFQVLVGSAEQSGAISESGGARPFEKIGAGELVLSAANSFSGATTISNGTLTVRGGQALNNTANVAIAAAGTLNIDDSETVGHVAGSGALIVDASSTLTLGGNNLSALFAGDSSGGGGITKTGTGNWLLTGDNAFGGLFNVAQGSVTVLPSGTLSSMSLSVANGASMLLGGSPQGTNGGGATGTGLGAISVVNGGTLYLDDNTSLSGASLTLAAGSNLNLFLTTSATPHPQITVTSANVSGANLGVYLDPLGFDGTTQILFDYDNVIASSAVTGNFANAAILQSPGLLFTVSTSYDAGGVDVQVQRLAFSDIIPDPNGNQAGLGAALEEIFVGGVSDPDLINLVQAIGAGSIADIVVLYSNVTGSIAAEAVQAAARTDDPFKQTVAERVNVARTPGCTVAGDTWCLRRYAQAAPQGPVMSDIQCDPTVFEWLDTGIRDTGTFSVWGRALAAWSDTEGSGNAAGARQRSYGFVGGVDRVFDSAFLAGLAGQYIQTEADYAGISNESSLQSVQFGAYASYGGAETYLNGTLSAIGSQGKSEREFRVSLIDYEMSSFMRSWTASASAELGTVIEDDGFRFEPSLGLNYAWTTTEDYAERGGGGLGLIIRPEDSQSLRSIVSARLSRVFDLGDRKIVPQLRVDWRHEMLDRGQSFNAAFAAAPDVFFAVEGTEYARDQVAMGASITARLTGNLTGYADLQTAFSEDTSSTMASVGVRATW